jgi:hypothetical protein
LVRDELALDRSVNFTGSFVVVANVLGHNPKSQISSWSIPGSREYSLKRLKAWDADVTRSNRAADPEAKPVNPGEGEHAAGALDFSKIKQKDIQIHSLIREPLWNKAKWVATVYGNTLKEASPPVFALAFRDREAAKEIFHSWRGDVGIRDNEDRLRVAIIRGINSSEPYWYRIHIGCNQTPAFSHGYAVFVSRINQMQPSSEVNLTRFLRVYGKFGTYLLVPAVASDETVEPALLLDDYLIKNKLHVREAWEIGKNDPDSVAIHSDDTPIVPAGQQHPPVSELLRWKQERSKS